MKLLLTGGTGLVGAALVPSIRKKFDVVTPTRNECDLLDTKRIAAYIHQEKPDVIIHSAGYVNAGAAEAERGDKNGVCYLTNVEGTRAVVSAGHDIGAFVCYISTGSVFHGTERNPGPFELDDQPETNPDNNNWYGYTKYLGELTGPDAIIRISHPAIPDKVRIKDDYIHKILALYERRMLFPLFPDQMFPLTFLTDLSDSIGILCEKKIPGIVHVASPNMVSPYTLTVHILEMLGKPVDDRIQKLSLEDFYKQGNSPLRFAKYAALGSKQTEKKLNIRFSDWKKIVSEVFSNGHTPLQ